MRVLWVTPHDLLIHDGFITNDGIGDVELRSLCGLSGNPHWESLAHDDSEITCPRCRALCVIQHLSPAA
jgi:hypothetical protein